MLNVLSINNCVPHLVRCGTLVADCFAVDTLAQGAPCGAKTGENEQKIGLFRALKIDFHNSETTFLFS